MTSPPPPRTKGPSFRFLTDYRFWLVVAMVAVGTLLHLGSESDWMGTRVVPIPILGSHDLHRLLYLIPIIYAAYAFGAGAGFALAAYTVLVFAPHALGEMQAGEWEHALFEFASTAGVGGLVGWLVATLVGQRHRLERTLNDLSQSERELQVQVQTVEADKRWHAALYAIAEACSQARELPALIEGALGALIKVLGLNHRAGVFLVDEERGELYLAAHQGLSPEFVAAEARVPLGECLCGLAAQSGELILSADSFADPRHTRMPLAEPHGHIILPLKSGGQVVGVAFFYPDSSYELVPTDLQLLAAAGAQVGLAIERLGLLEKEREARRHAEAEQRRLASLNLLSQEVSHSLREQQFLDRALALVLETTGFEMGGIRLLQEDNGFPLVASQNLLPGLLDLEARLGAGGALQGRSLVASGEADFVEDTARHPRLGQALPEQGVRSLAMVPMRSQDHVIGGLMVAASQPHPFTGAERELLLSAANIIGMAVENARLFEKEHEQRQRAEALAEASIAARDQLENAYLEITRALVASLETKDYYTGGHSARVRQYSRQIALEMGLSPEEIETISLAAELHDLGKIGVPDRILLKPGPLEPAERAEIKRHPERGVDILRHLGFLGQVLPIIRAHHERVDGQGYPDNLPNGAIPLGGRILAVADAYDAITSERPYRPAYTHEQALAILRENAGSQWDPQVVAAFIASLEKTGAPPRPKSPLPRRQPS